jgi:hypothetical protein
MIEHIHERRLFETAQERVTLNEEERQHLHVCEECQDLYRVFTSQHFYGKTPPPKKDSGSAA